jgi:hypothetical protein
MKDTIFVTLQGILAYPKIDECEDSFSSVLIMNTAEAAKLKAAHNRLKVSLKIDHLTNDPGFCMTSSKAYFENLPEQYTHYRNLTKGKKSWMKCFDKNKAQLRVTDFKAGDLVVVVCRVFLTEYNNIKRSGVGINEIYLLTPSYIDFKSSALEEASNEALKMIERSNAIDEEYELD